ncbi:MAG: UDP-N-acetylmuramoyl-tripeptide--D-alanyl-D-alanine ligase [Muribaculaceae bacterium]|nr:UDP-N-acetylmuramoyl-tripeptide--D-alanyl-D-alanine ligase [Muribaculaceae bacterium]
MMSFIESADFITVVTVLVALVTLINVLVEYKRDLMMLQQNSYRNERYEKWLRVSGDTTTGVRLAALVVLMISLVRFVDIRWAMGLIAVFSGGCTIWRLKMKYKKPLVWTNRAKRIYTVMLAISFIVAFVVYAVASAYTSGLEPLFIFTLSWLFMYCCSHGVILVSNWLLKPVEKRINKGYYDDAARILASMPDLRVIGVTGSYGKTSTKHYLQRILSEKYDVLMTPGSYNTTMGVIRTIREVLKPYNEVFIVEMGAKQPGDIDEICKLVHPEIGIVTAVGEQHLESFGNIENVQKTKFELIDSLPENGLAVVNDDFEYVANRKVSNVECVRYGIKNAGNADYTAINIEYGTHGTTFVVVGNGKTLNLSTKLVGECNISNLIAAVIVALYLEVPEDKIRYAVERIEQVEHRLNLKRTPGGITIIDDAFNSNPTGSAMALDVLSRMKGGKRIIITPGMIELGDRQYELNKQFGLNIAKSVDVAIVVGEYNRAAILEGLSDGHMPDANVHAVPTFAASQQLLARIAMPGDTVLYENDLPDTFK